MTGYRVAIYIKRVPVQQQRQCVDFNASNLLSRMDIEDVDVGKTIDWSPFGGTVRVIA